MTVSADLLAREERSLVTYLMNVVCDRASGRSEDECVRNYPRDVYFIGNLRPRDDQEEKDPDAPPLYEELRSKSAPVANGVEFLLRLSDEGMAKLGATVFFTCYYRVFPTLDQQRHHQPSYIPESSVESLRPEPAKSGPQKANPDDDEEDDDDTPSPDALESQSDRRRRRNPKDSLFLRFKKIECKANGDIAIAISDDARRCDTSALKAAIAAEIARAERIANADPDRIRTSEQAWSRVDVPADALTSESSYDAFRKSLRTNVNPKWSIDLECSTRRDDTSASLEWIVRFEFTNASPPQSTPEGKDNPNVEAFLFDVRSEFAAVQGQVLPFEVDLAPKGFRYDRTLWGRGFNCAAGRLSQNGIQTTNAPAYEQGRHTTRNLPDARFEALAVDPLPVLGAIYGAMQSYLTTWSDQQKTYSASPSWTQAYEKEFGEDRKAFEEEIRRFKAGLDLLAADRDCLEAFRLTNATFQRAGANPNPSKRKESWRLFQIVFIVGQVPGIWSLANPGSAEERERELVDIIYFPTGGGKTEAYLGTIVFHCFFDRLRGKSAGTTVWTRFPLRLLTLQQTQRVADVLGIAELVRRGHSDRRLSSASEFAVGYFVGKEGTPNEIYDPAKNKFADDEARVNWSLATDAVARQAWKRVTRCPSCKTETVTVNFDQVTARLFHQCTNQACAFPNGILPCYIVDNEIYRYLPTVVVGTLDKLAGLGNQRKLAQVFGSVDGVCRIHGFYKGKCTQKDCDDLRSLRPGVPAGLSGPTLFLQDELHLLKEGLGTFDSHYESFAQRLRREFGAKDTLKIIASSATIEAFARQVQHLYARQPDQAKVFPGIGPTLRESFYASTDAERLQRVFVGILPHNKTIFNAVLELIESYHVAVQQLAALPAGSPSPWGGRIAPATLDWTTLLDNYVTSVTYFLSGRDLNSIRTDIVGDVNPTLARKGLAALELNDLTGDTDTDEVSRVLQKLETPSSALTPRSILATNMISHGVDVDRLNAMLFYGMPRQTAEYIQSSSRVGRSHVGLVFCCCHPIRERDRSHYEYFTKYHQFLGQLVEPVAINRWATFSAQRTLPGLFMAVLLQVIANRAPASEMGKFYRVSHLKQKITSGALRPVDFFPVLEDAYLAQNGDPVGLALFRAEIRRRVPQFFDQILAASDGFVSDVLIPAPMKSLRDVDDPVVIELDTTGSQWAST